MQYQGTKVERDVVINGDSSHEVVRKSSASYEPSDKDRTMAKLERFRSVGDWVIGAICAVLGARILLYLLAANPDAGFTQFIQAVTAPLVAPFTTLFGVPTLGASVLDTAALVALIVYPIVGYGLISLAKTVMAPPDPTGQAYQ